MKLTVLLTVFMSLMTSTGSAQEAPKNLQLSCEFPVNKSDTLTSLKQRFGNSIQIEEIDGAEGETEKVVVIQDKKTGAASRLEVFFADPAMTQLTGIRINSEKNQWSYQGLRIGDTIEKVQNQNGKPFILFGFGWDYGGHITSFQGGKFDTMSDSCRVRLRINLDSRKPQSNKITGDKKLKSDLPELKRAGAYLSDITLDFSTKK